MTDTQAREPRPIGWTGPTGVVVTAHLEFMVATDNRKGRAQTIAYGTAEVYAWPPSDDGFVGVEIGIPNGLDLFKDGHAARFLIDSDKEFGLYYVATFHPTERNIGLKHMRRSMWIPEDDGPKKLYHLRITTRKDS